MYTIIHAHLMYNGPRGVLSSVKETKCLGTLLPRVNQLPTTNAKESLNHKDNTGACAHTSYGKWPPSPVYPVDRAGWQAKMASIELCGRRDAHSPHSSINIQKMRSVLSTSLYSWLGTILPISDNGHGQTEYATQSFFFFFFSFYQSPDKK